MDRNLGCFKYKQQNLLRHWADTARQTTTSGQAATNVIIARHRTQEVEQNKLANTDCEFVTAHQMALMTVGCQA